MKQFYYYYGKDLLMIEKNIIRFIILHFNKN